MPSGGDDKNEDSIGVFLMLKGADSRSFMARYTLGIVGKNENIECHFEYQGKSFKRGYGIKDLLKQSDFLNPDLGYLVGGKATIYCRVSNPLLYKTFANNFFQLTITAKEVPKDGKTALLYQRQIDKFKIMFDGEIFTDFEIKTSDKKVLKAHKSVLAVGSPFFFGMLTTDMKENNENIAKVPEDSAIMKEVLRFLYSSEVENLDSIAYELAIAAEKYQLVDLKEMCINSIIKTIDSENVLQTLMASYRLKSSKLKDKCVEMIAKYVDKVHSFKHVNNHELLFSNFQFVSQSEEWSSLPSYVFLEITRRISEDKGCIYV